VRVARARPRCALAAAGGCARPRMRARPAWSSGRSGAAWQACRIELAPSVACRAPGGSAAGTVWPIRRAEPAARARARRLPCSARTRTAWCRSAARRRSCLAWTPLVSKVCRTINDVNLVSLGTPQGFGCHPPCSRRFAHSSFPALQRWLELQAVTTPIWHSAAQLPHAMRAIELSSPVWCLRVHMGQKRTHHTRLCLCTWSPR